MIDPSRPVRGQDIDDLREMLGLTTGDMVWLLGITTNRWSDITSDEARLKPLDGNNAPIAIYARLLDKYPELCIVPKMPSPEEIFDTISKVDPSLNMKDMSLLLGREASSCFHWLKCGRRASPQVSRLGYMIEQLIKRDTKGEGKNALFDVKSIVQTESSARGIKNLLSAGSWNIKDGTSTRGRRKKVVEEAEV